MGALRIRRGLSSSWALANPILDSGEMGLETDTRQIKIGDGSSFWNTLGYFSSSGDVSVIVAAGDIPAFSAVTSTGLQANSANTGHYGKIVGIASTHIASGFSGEVQLMGDLTNPAWTWTQGDLIFLNGTALSKTPPGTGFVQPLGTAKSAVTILVEIGPPVLL